MKLSYLFNHFCVSLLGGISLQGILSPVSRACVWAERFRKPELCIRALNAEDLQGRRGTFDDLCEVKALCAVSVQIKAPSRNCSSLPLSAIATLTPAEPGTVTELVPGPQSMPAFTTD